jgi:Bacterial transcriptional regulator/IclR helix-turn-helix domain
VAGNSREAGRSVTSKVVAILETFCHGSIYSLTEIAHHTELPISTVHRLATELASLGLLERTTTRTTARAFRCGSSALHVCVPDRLRRALAEIRLNGLAMSRWELQLGVSAVAAPVFGPGGQVVAAIELPVRDLRVELPRLQPALVVAARWLSRQLGLVSNGKAVQVNEAPRHRSITETMAPDHPETGRPRARNCSKSARSWPSRSNVSTAPTSSAWVSCRCSSCPDSQPTR